MKAPFVNQRLIPVGFSNKADPLVPQPDQVIDRVFNSAGRVADNLRNVVLRLPMCLFEEKQVGLKKKKLCG